MKVMPRVDGGADDRDALLLVLLPADVVAAQADDGHLLPGAPQLAGSACRRGPFLWASPACRTPGPPPAARGTAAVAATTLRNSRRFMETSLSFARHSHFRPTLRPVVRSRRSVRDELPVARPRQVDNNGFLTTPHDDPLRRLIGRRIDLLMRDVGRDEHEVARLQIDLVLQPASPAHFARARQHVHHRLLIAVMMHRACRVGFGQHDTGPQGIRPDPAVRNGRQPPHPGCLRRVVVELTGLDDPHVSGSA